MRLVVKYRNNFSIKTTEFIEKYNVHCYQNMITKFPQVS